MSTKTKFLVLGLVAMGMSSAILRAEPPPGVAAPTPTIITPQGVPAPVPAIPGATAAPATATGAGHIQFETPVADFGRAKAGDPIKYTYYFTNTGDATLEVTHVQPSCGCTTAGDWTRKVEPGKTGIVPVQLNSAALPPGGVFKTITVSSSDPKQPSTSLQLKGTIWKPIELQPTYAALNIPPDAPAASTVVRIINNTDEQFTLSAPESNNRGFSATVITNQPYKEYQITISTVPPLPTGPMQAEISIKTTSTNAPVLKIPFWVNVQPAVMVMPPSVMLPPPPLKDKAMPSVMIQNNSTNMLTLSEAMVSSSATGVFGLTNNTPATGVEVQVKEAQQGKTYNVSLTFPAGFELPPGQQLYFTAKSTLPQMPLIKVPISQMPKPVQPQVLAPTITPAPPNPPPVHTTSANTPLGTQQ